MKRILFVVAVLGLAQEASAIELGTTAGFGTGGFGFFGTRLGPGWGSRSFAPTFDLRTDALHFQFHVLDLLSTLNAGNGLFLGANGYYRLHEADVGGPWTGVIQPGGSVDLWIDDDAFIALAAEGRFGIEAVGSAGFGIYVVPALGIAIDRGTLDLVTGGTVQISAFFGG